MENYLLIIMKYPIDWFLCWCQDIDSDLVECLQLYPKRKQRSSGSDSSDYGDTSDEEDDTTTVTPL